MAQFDPLNIIEVRINYTVNAQQCVNVLHYHANSAIAGLDLQAALQDLADLVCEDANGSIVYAMREMMSDSDVLFTRCDVQRIYPVRFRDIRKTLTFTGNVTDSCAAQNLQASIQKWGAEANRHNVGAFHLGGLVAGAYDNGLLVNAYQTKLATLATLLKNNITSEVYEDLDFYPVILNRTKVVVDGKDTYPISGRTDVVGTEGKDTIRTMRRRTLRIGQ